VDDEAESDPNALGMELSVLWSPIEFMRDKLKSTKTG